MTGGAAETGSACGAAGLPSPRSRHCLWTPSILRRLPNARASRRNAPSKPAAGAIPKPGIGATASSRARIAGSPRGLPSLRGAQRPSAGCRCTGGHRRRSRQMYQRPSALHHRGRRLLQSAYGRAVLGVRLSALLRQQSPSLDHVPESRHGRRQAQAIAALRWSKRIEVSHIVIQSPLRSNAAAAR